MYDITYEEIRAQWQIYAYNDEKAKESKLITSYMKMILLAIVTLIPMIFLLVSVGNMLDMMDEMILLLVGVVLLWMCGIVCYMQKVFPATMKGYIRDEVGTWWEIYLTKGASARGLKRINQLSDSNADAETETMLASYLVKHKQGVKLWNPLSGGEAKITCLTGLKQVSEGRYTYRCTYNKNNRIMKIKIFKFYK